MARDNDRYPPIAVRGRKLKAIKYAMPVASAQVKSALLQYFLCGRRTEIGQSR